MKKTLLLALFALLIPIIVNAIEVEGIYYRLVPNNKAFVNGYTGESSSIVIPSTITLQGKVYDVIGIAKFAFEGCSGLISITIPESVTSIGESAFRGCGLTSVTIPGSVSFGGRVFSSCTGLTSVTILEGVTSIYEAAFEDCSSLTSVTIPSSVTKIEKNAFKHCSSLTSIAIPNSVITIEGEAFRGCSGLTSITIPNSVTIF